MLELVSDINTFPTKDTFPAVGRMILCCAGNVTPILKNALNAKEELFRLDVTSFLHRDRMRQRSLHFGLKIFLLKKKVPILPES